jgi:hypothetical protein
MYFFLFQPLTLNLLEVGLTIHFLGSFLIRLYIFFYLLLMRLSQSHVQTHK